MTPLITLSFSNSKILGFNIKFLGNKQPLEYSIFNNINLNSTVIEYIMSYDEMNDKMKAAYTEEIRVFLLGEGDIIPTINEFKISLIQVWLNDNFTIYFKNYDDYRSVILA